MSYQAVAPQGTNNKAAFRVANTIRSFKWILIASEVIWGFIILLVLNSQEEWPTWTSAVGPLFLVGSLLAAVTTWVLFGWFEHTLRLLAKITA